MTPESTNAEEPFQHCCVTLTWSTTIKRDVCGAESAKARSLRVLGLVSHTGALTASIVQEAFRKCALAWHPDRHPGPLKHTAEAKFKEVQAAYQLLKVTCVQ